ncbi:MAG: N-6 DNA methylase, partial [Halomonadaceae bacterium]
KVIDTYKQRDTRDKYSYVASLEEIQENDFNLNIPRFVDTFEEEDEIDLMVVQAERKEIEAEIAKLNEQMDGYLKELGYAN